MTLLFIEMLHEYRERSEFLVHAFVVMPNHIHLLVSPSRTLERVLQLFKGGFSFRARDRFNITKVWQQRKYDRRIRDFEEFVAAREYIHQNPVKAGIVERAEDFPYSSANAAFKVDGVPQWLKPRSEAARTQG